MSERSRAVLSLVPGTGPSAVLDVREVAVEAASGRERAALLRETGRVHLALSGGHQRRSERLRQRGFHTNADELSARAAAMRSHAGALSEQADEVEAEACALVRSWVEQQRSVVDGDAVAARLLDDVSTILFAHPGPTTCCS